MNPYKEIAREHLSIEDLEELLREKKQEKQLEAKSLSEYDQRFNYYYNKIMARNKS